MKAFTHVGTLSGDARSGGQQFRTKLRLTPSGSHWVDPQGRKYPKRGGGYVGDKWPMYFLSVESIAEITAQGMAGEATRREGGSAPSGAPSPVAESDAPKGSSK